MLRKMFAGAFLALIGTVIFSVSMAQNTNGSKHISKTEIMKGLDASQPGLGGQAFPIVPGHDSLVVRRRMAGANNASIHSTATDGQDFTEVSEVLDGSGTFMIGGHWIENSDVAYNKRDRSKGITGGVTYDAKPGDFFVVPPGTPHWFPKINGYIIVVETRIPGNVMAQAKK